LIFSSGILFFSGSASYGTGLSTTTGNSVSNSMLKMAKRKQPNNTATKIKPQHVNQVFMSGFSISF